MIDCVVFAVKQSKKLILYSLSIYSQKDTKHYHLLKYNLLQNTFVVSTQILQFTT